MLVALDDTWTVGAAVPLGGLSGLDTALLPDGHLIIVAGAASDPVWVDSERPIFLDVDSGLVRNDLPHETLVRPIQTKLVSTC